MGTLDDIGQKLSSGSTVGQLIEEGYAKSSVTLVARKLKNARPAAPPGSPVDDELQELRHQKETIKLQKEIADLEAGKDRLPERVTVLEKAFPELRSFVSQVVEVALWQGLVSGGMDREEAKEFSDGWVDRCIKWRDGR